MKDLAERKRALIAEAEVYRETLKLQFQTLRIYGLSQQRRLFTPNLGNPILLLLAGRVTKLFFRRKASGGDWLQRGASLAPVIMGIFKQVASRLMPYLARRRLAKKSFLSRRG